MIKGLIKSEQGYHGFSIRKRCHESIDNNAIENSFWATITKRKEKSLKSRKSGIHEKNLNDVMGKMFCYNLFPINSNEIRRVTTELKTQHKTCQYCRGEGIHRLALNALLCKTFPSRCVNPSSFTEYSLLEPAAIFITSKSK